MNLIKQPRAVKKQHKRPEERSEGSPANPNVTGMAGLQRSVGNRAVQRLVAEQQAAKETTAQREEEQAPQTPDEAVIDEEALKNLSGPDWVDKFPAGDSLNDLTNDFGECAGRFIAALEKAGAEVEILATAWPPERAYLMHWAWQIATEAVDPRQAPPITEIDFETDASPDLEINWWHGSLEASQQAAQEMVEAFGIADLEAPPPLASKHVAGEAIDLRISWGGPALLVEGPGGEPVEIRGGPQDGAHPALIALGLTYGLVHFPEADEDGAHWSVDGS